MSPAGADQDKPALRARLRQARRELPPAQVLAETGATVATCLDLLARLRPPALASYLAAGSELDLADLHRRWWEGGRALLVPRVTVPGQLAWHAITRLAQCRPGAHGILEPDPGLAPASGLDAGTVVLVPGLGFTADGQRLGQGAGYYDRALAADGLVPIGVGFACQRCASLPCEPHDRPVLGLVLGGTLVRAPTAPRLPS